jgi:hypothetical protein
MKMKTFKVSIELSMQESIAYDIAPCNMKSKEFKESLEKLISDHYFGYCYAHEFQVKVK